MDSPDEQSDLETWLGIARDELDQRQEKSLASILSAINTRWPDPDDSAEREAALTAATQTMLGELTVKQAGQDCSNARREAARTLAALAGALHAESVTVHAGPNSERALAERAGISRQTVRRTLGRQPR
ncbi:MAG: hypothetical protein U0990_11465 [Candidatus Nanopelagicales bacterium]|nr:hypothetical protein [Candidatus Nanopelagicales bacterium]